MAAAVAASISATDASCAGVRSGSRFSRLFARLASSQRVEESAAVSYKLKELGLTLGDR